MSHHKSILELIVAAGIFLSFEPVSAGGSLPPLTPVTVFADAFNNEESNIQVRQSGEIVSVLADDTVGDRHQRMIIRLTNNQTLLIAHNIDLSPRIPNPQVGKQLGFYGEYEWNEKGGTIHWTHEDPDGSHIAGWLEYEGKKYGSLTTTKTIGASVLPHHFLQVTGNTLSYCRVTLQGKSLASLTSSSATLVYFEKAKSRQGGHIQF